MAKYNIYRYYAHGKSPDLIKVVDSLEQAQEHCSDETTRKAGQWFDGYKKAEGQE